MTRVGPTLDVRLDPDSMREALERDAIAGLTSTPKTLSPVWFYDEIGSELFDEITRLDEYYPTRAERRLLEAHAPGIARASCATTLVELGAGTCTKTRILLDAMQREGNLERYVGIDVAESTLLAATHEISHEYPGIEVAAIIADFHDLCDLMSGTGPKLIAFLGGTIGNFEPDQRRAFFANLRAELTESDSFLIGTDLVKDRERLVAAYDDSRGVTAAFNLNMLSVLNKELGADFDTTQFKHLVFFDEEQKWIEMRLQAVSRQHVVIDRLGIEVTFEQGEEIRTEISAKFTAEGIRAELVEGGFSVDRQFDQPGGEFLVTLSHSMP